MNPGDQELLKHYAESRAEEAFAAIVQRHLPLVFAVAKRQVGGDAHLAADVAQTVFADLARKARRVSTCGALSGWLVRATHFAASDVVRKERRRRAREWEAHMHHLDSSDDTQPMDQERLRRAVDAALVALGDRDRDAVMLRFFDGQPFAAIGERLRTSEDAARMRVERALTRLRRQLERRGIRTSAALLTATIAEAGTGSVPPALAAQITEGAVAGAAATGVLLPSWAISAGVIATFAVLAGAFALSDAESLRQINPRHEAARAALEQAEKDLRATQALRRAAEDDNARLRAAIGSSSFAAIVSPAVNRIAFVIDTSGSMRDPKNGYLHSIVTDTLAATLARRAEARAFHLLDTDGRSIDGPGGQLWFSNDPQGLASALTALRAYRQDSQSNPVPGIERALILLDGLRDPRSHLEIVVLGDEHIGRRDAATAQLEQLNPVDGSGRRQVTISAVAFPTWLGAPNPERWQREKPNTHLSYERLMREVAGRHGGSFTAAPTLGSQ